ncbi:CRISPR-associated helicase Cas3' [Tumidithrix elongata RA019]|uniref:CRISPR-associated helicase Cas3 n=1 Tax=Tumidithrix elongata BACA0141 TaxID=2716417 RepID=A0AAW9PY92_9CYAN|nr:CRISPR-associated helicase Cas3' [Tumidithrix elongata RA019]
MTKAIQECFQQLTTFEPRQFQSATIAAILKGQNILLRAPTGSGKTETAIAAYLFAKQMEIEFPNKLIYIVPLRTLATSLRDRTQELIRRWEKEYPPKRSLVVTLQTGENPEDPRFEGDIIFCTIDQLLSSFLSIPYSVGRGSANVNAGVVFASYLVFDELHLLDPDRSFVTTLKLLEQVQGISPFLLMTATLTHELAGQICQEITTLGNSDKTALQLVNVAGKDLEAIEGQRVRQFQTMTEPLSAYEIWQDIQLFDRQRVIVICNTVAQSQGLYQDLENLCKKDSVSITLLHSRFLPSDRKSKESQLENVFGKDWKIGNKQCQVLISTQVIEAGINITCQVMHTVLCPANSLLQRAGRCARFANENGLVKVYREVKVGDDAEKWIELEDEDDFIDAVEQPQKQSKKQRFLPYKNLSCELTWDVLSDRAEDEVSKSVGFEIEEKWINHVHTKEDLSQAGKRAENRSSFEQQFDEAIFRGKRSVANDLIRFVDNRSIFMMEDQVIFDSDTQSIDLKQLQAFSIPKSTLCSIFWKFQQSQNKNWLFKQVKAPEDKSGERYEIPNAIPIKNCKQIAESIQIIVNPKYADYDSKVGLRLGAEVEGNYKSQQKQAKPKLYKEYSYHMDTYVRHLVDIGKCWLNDFDGDLMIQGKPTTVKLISSQSELLKAGGRFIHQRIFPNSSLDDATGLFELLVCFSILTHDLGKLQVEWQKAMRGWQKTAYELYCGLEPKPNFQVIDPKDQLLAHTDHQPSHAVFKQAYDDYTQKNPRPSHAVESAFLSEEILEEVLFPVLEDHFNEDDEKVLLNIAHSIQMAAGRHHSAWAKGWDGAKSSEKIQIHRGANIEVARSWRSLRKMMPSRFVLPEQLPELQQTHQLDEFRLGQIEPDDVKYQQLYWLIVRALRICDGRSVQLQRG